MTTRRDSRTWAARAATACCLAMTLLLAACAPGSDLVRSGQKLIDHDLLVGLWTGHAKGVGLRSRGASVLNERSRSGTCPNFPLSGTPPPTPARITEVLAVAGPLHPASRGPPPPMGEEN